jgi:hypothetical protein
MIKKQRTRWKPPGATTVMDKDRLGTIFLYTRDGRPAAVGYAGRSTKPDVHVIKSTQSEIEAVVRRWLDGLRAHVETRNKYRAMREQDEWSRNNVIKRIKTALAKRGYKYSVTGGSGTAWGWIHIDLMPAELKLLTPERRQAAYRRMAEALGMKYAGDGVSVPASTAHYREYLERAEGKMPTKIAEAYWD